ncbi:AraC-type DNA-binding protein [Pedobacter steynii]|uniref:AraC-type DNA-binding protein n=1 Tax=Pedobacter steynii TaxID=430522 RepID=A0A1G9PVL1_9SPHI|nr:helix-turn-helix domain-containing protein [Pedobacter steynii]NQX38881.1 helix-turn-helix transcriptional regulator [Pedobacter steynii]SDM02145.1 AraC-type DNA-binding protein [Pedobacter steynii]
MSKTESLEDFYREKFNWLPDNLQEGIGHFNVFNLENHLGPNAVPVKYSRRDFYKVCLMRGRNIYHYADKSVEISGSTLMFFNPKVPYTWECLNDDGSGYFCIFTDAFFTEKMRGNLTELPMFAPGGKPSFVLNEEQDKQVTVLFLKMMEERDSDYVYKYDLIRNYVTELIHFALKIQPAENLYRHPDANSRITAVFTELLERQFPIETPRQRFTMRSAADFAQQLAVHVNHLNRAIKETTGKTTTMHITERIVTEAKALLKHTDWNVAEIACCLGFEESAHFNNYFKKHTRFNPSQFRNV